MTGSLQREDGPPLVLASGSSARAAMLEAAGITCICRPAAVDEGEIKASFKAAGGSAGDAAIALSELKASRIASQLPAETIVLGADQILTCEDIWFDKAEDLRAARVHLGALAGKPHTLHTAVVGFRGGARIWHHLDETRLWMRPLSPAFIERYLDLFGEGLLETVGGYQIERFGPHLFTRIDGDHFAILGLPLLPTLGFLRDQGVLLA